MIRVSAPNLAIAKIYRGMLERARDWRPVRHKAKTIWAREHERYYAAEPVGQMEKLGPKIIDKPSFSMGKRFMKFGVRSNYAVYYDAWRQRTGKPPLFVITPELEEDLAITWIDHILDEARS